MTSSKQWSSRWGSITFNIIYLKERRNYSAPLAVGLETTPPQGITPSPSTPPRGRSGILSTVPPRGPAWADWSRSLAKNFCSRVGRFCGEFLVEAKAPRPLPCGVQVLLYGCSGLSFATLAVRRCRRQCVVGNCENIQILHPNRVLQKRLALSIVRISPSV